MRATRGFKYLHYKGAVYEGTSTFVRHTETDEDLVVYRSLDGGYSARPRVIFEDTVMVRGVELPRFLNLHEPSCWTESATNRLVKAALGYTPPSAEHFMYVTGADDNNQLIVQPLGEFLRDHVYVSSDEQL